MRITSNQLRRLIEQEISATSRKRDSHIDESVVRRIINEEIVSFLMEGSDDGKPDDGKIDSTGSIDAVAASIAKDLKREDLKGPITAAIKKKKGGKDAAELSTNDKTSLADAFLELVFADPDAVTKVAAKLKTIVQK